MLGWLRGKRFDRRTTLVVLAVALVAWAAVVYVNVRNFVPEELRDTTRAPAGRVA